MGWSRDQDRYCQWSLHLHAIRYHGGWNGIILFPWSNWLLIADDVMVLLIRWTLVKYRLAWFCGWERFSNLMLIVQLPRNIVPKRMDNCGWALYDVNENMNLRSRWFDAILWHIFRSKSQQKSCRTYNNSQLSRNLKLIVLNYRFEE